MTKPLYERRFTAIAASVKSAMAQDGWNTDRKTTVDFMDHLLLLPEVFHDPARALNELARTLQKAARYAATNTRKTPELRPANADESLARPALLTG